MNTFTKIPVCLSLGLSLVLLPPTLALAASPTAAQATQAEQTSQSISTIATTAVPPSLELNAKPGTTIQKTIKIVNSSQYIQKYVSNVQDFIVADDGKTPMPVPGSLPSRYSLASWVTISPTQFTLKPNETQIMDVLVQVPFDARPGGHYAMVIHKPEPIAHSPSGLLTTQGSAGIAARVGSLLYLTVAGNVQEEAFIREFQAPSWVEFGPVDMSYKVENRSDIHIRPQSSIEVRDMLGRLVDVIKVSEYNIFPFTSREFTASYNHYWGLGKYTAKLVTPYGTHGNVTTALLSFWIIPYRVIIGIGLFFSSIVAIIILVRRYLIHRSDEKTREIEALKKKVEELEDKQS